MDLQVLGRHSYRVVIAYDGTAYSGWQLQAAVPTVQAAVEAALGTILQETRDKLGVSAAGRTDAGVHAKGQVVQFYTDKEPDAERLPRRLNSLLPPDVRALAAFRTAPDFHVTISAESKVYRYFVDNRPVHDPTTHRYMAHYPWPLDLGEMRAAARIFLGRHDFTQFSNHGPDTAKRNPIKVMYNVAVKVVDDGVIGVEVHGEGFLYKQVRHMVGALLAVGSGRMEVDKMYTALEVGSAQLPGRGGVCRGWNVAPAKGLYLHAVHYPSAVDDPTTLLYPDFPHDEFGRLIMRLPGDVGADSE